MIERLRLVPAEARQLAPAEWAMLVPFGVFCFVYPFGIFLMSFDLMPFGMEWMSSLLLATLGLATAAWAWLNFGGAGIVASLLVFAGGLALEYLGVYTGVPFGRYSYTGVLVPGLPGGVPLAIGFAWTFIVVSGLFTAYLLLERLRPGVSRPAVCLAGAGLAVGLDLLLEPVAFHVKDYWRWLDPEAGYYGVPWSNFVAWLVAAFLMDLLVSALMQRKGPLDWAWLPVVLYAMNVAMFGIVNLAHGIWAPALIGLALLVLLGWGLTRARAVGPARP